MMQTVQLKSAPEVKQVVTAAFPSYRKQAAFLSVFNGGVQINSYWDGGSRDEFAIVDLATMSRKVLPTRTHPFFDVASKGLIGQSNDDVTVDHVGNVTLNRLPEGFALVAAGTFCGKPATAHVYMNGENMAKLLPAYTDRGTRINHTEYDNPTCDSCGQPASEHSSGGSGIAGALHNTGSLLHQDPGQLGFGQTCPLCGGDGYYVPDPRYTERGINLNEQ